VKSRVAQLQAVAKYCAKTAAKKNNGEEGIRTPEENFSLVFKTRAFDRSATSPLNLLYTKIYKDLY